MTTPLETVFVFGSNRQGRHGKGAALHAVKKWGAIYGQAVGRQGNAYAIITKELRRDYPPVTLDEVSAGVRGFLHYALIYPNIRFKVSAIGCGLAGFTPEDIAPLFLWRGNNEPRPNVILPPEFKEVLKNRPREEPARQPATYWPTDALPNPYRWQELSQVPQCPPYFENPDGTRGWTAQSLTNVMNEWDRFAELDRMARSAVPHTLPTPLPGCAPPIQESPEFRRLVNALQQPMPMWGDEPTGANIRTPLHARFPNDDIHDDEAPF